MAIAEVLSESRSRHALEIATRVLAGVGAGAFIGLVAAEQTPAHVEIAGSTADVYIQPGQNDQFSLDGLLTGKKPADRKILGENVVTKVDLNFDSSALITPDGKFDSKILPTYIQLFSDPEHIKDDIVSSLIEHYGVIIGLGALLGGVAVGGGYGYKRWRRNYNQQHGLDADLVSRYHAPERTFTRRVAYGLAISSLLTAVPSSTTTVPDVKPIVGDPALASTPLAGIELSGPLVPVIHAAEGYINKYFKQTNTYYNHLADRLKSFLDTNPAVIPSGSDVVNFAVVADRHCNTGMDRVIVPLMEQYNLHTLVSAGDDDLNGSFSFESGCTSDLAERLKKAKVQGVFVRGNHDSAATATDETKQHLKVLDDTIYSGNDLNIIGEHDPRDSRWGKPIVPNSDESQRTVVVAQGKRIGAIACKSNKKMIALLHDPLAGQTAIESGCGNIVLAIDGHMHRRSGPNLITGSAGQPPTAQTALGYQFTAASAGGAPTHMQHTGNPLEDVTVGPLNHTAEVYIVSVKKDAGELIGITDFIFNPDKSIAVQQQIIQPSYFVPKHSDGTAPVPSESLMPSSGLAPSASATR